MKNYLFESYNRVLGHNTSYKIECHFLTIGFGCRVVLIDNLDGTGLNAISTALVWAVMAGEFVFVITFAFFILRSTTN